MLGTPHFCVEFSVSRRLGPVYATLCEKAYKKLSTVFQVPDTDTVWEGKCHVYLFSGKDEFVAFAANVHESEKGTESGGYTRISRKDPDIVLYLNSKHNHTLLQQTLVHEMTHVFLQLFHKNVRIHTWLHEGFAQFFEFQHHPRQSRLARSRRLIKGMVKRRSYVRFREFWVCDFPPTDLASYSQAWSMVDFLTHTKDLRRKTGKFLLALKDQGNNLEPPTVADQEKAFKAAFGRSLAELETRWKRYVVSRY